eukprot:620678-Rhodomonas_salina.2
MGPDWARCMDVRYRDSMRGCICTRRGAERGGSQVFEEEVEGHVGQAPGGGEEVQSAMLKCNAKCNANALRDARYCMRVRSTAALCAMHTDLDARDAIRRTGLA